MTGPLRARDCFSAARGRAIRVHSPSNSTSLCRLLTKLTMTYHRNFRVRGTLRLTRGACIGMGVRRGRGRSGLGTLTRLPSDYITSTSYLRRRQTVFRRCGMFDSTVVSNVVHGLHGCRSGALHTSLSKGPRRVLSLIRGCFRYKWYDG